MTHVPILAHGKAREVLIVGGGDCGIAEEVLKHKSVKRLTQVEIDASVVEFSKEHFPEFTKPVLADKRFDLVIDDGMKYVAKTDRRFDVIIVDSNRSAGPGKVLFSQKFYAACRRCMTQGRRDGHAERRADLSAGRAHVRASASFAGCSPTATATSRRSRPMSAATMAMGWAHRQREAAPDLGQDHRRARYRKAGRFPTKYWTPRGARGGVRAARFIAENGESKSAAAASAPCMRSGVAHSDVPIGLGRESFTRTSHAKPLGS